MSDRLITFGSILFILAFILATAFFVGASNRHVELWLQFILLCMVVIVAALVVRVLLPLFRVSPTRRQLEDLERQIKSLGERIGRIEARQREELWLDVDLEGVAVPKAEAAGPGAAPARAPTRPAGPPPPAKIPERESPADAAVSYGASPDWLPHLTRDQQWREGLEETIGKRWMTWAGALAIFIAAAFFLKHAFENQWLGPTGRVALGVVAGIAVLAFGDLCVRRGMRILGQGLIGGSLGILYVSLFAAFSLYQLVPQIPAFGFMALVTAAGMALAILHNALPLAFIAVLGGFITPLLASTGADSRDALFAYLTVLDLGVLGVAIFRRWRALDALAFLGTWIMFAGWFAKFYRPAAMTPALLWIGCFFLIFLIVPFVYQLRTRSAAQVESFVLALGNGALSFAYVYHILRQEYLFAVGFVALFLTFCYVGLAAAIRRRVPQDTQSLFGFVGLSVVFLTLAAPLQLKLHGVTLAWSIEGPVLVFLGYIFRYRPVRIAGFLVLALAAARLFTAHWPLHTAFFDLFLNRHFAAAMSVPLAAAAYALIHFRFQDESTEWDRRLMTAAAIGAGLVAIVIFHGEVGAWFWYRAVEPIRDRGYLYSCAVTTVWAVGALGFLAAGRKLSSRISVYAGLAPLAVAAILLIASYSYSNPRPWTLFVNYRFIAGLVVMAALIRYAFVAKGSGGLFDENGGKFAGALSWIAGLLPLVLLSLEVYCYCSETIADRTHARWAGQMSLSVIWGVYAAAALAAGFWRRVKELRFAALALFALVVLKVVFVDMAAVQQIYRIVSFLALGLFLIGASYLYHRLEKRLGGK
jgi:uncharacterized membrane protein